MVEATNSSVIRGTPRMNSMKLTQAHRMTTSLDCLPRASRMPIGSEKAMPVTPMTRVSMNPPNWSVATGSSPRPPSSSQPQISGKHMEYSRPYLRPGSRSYSSGTSAASSRMKDRLTRHRCSAG